VALCTAVGDQTVPTIAADATGGAIVAWQDGQNGAGNNDIYAVRVRSNGLITAVSPVASQEFAPALVHPNPFHSQLTIDFSMTVETPVRMEVFDLAGRRVRVSPTTFLSPGRHSLTWDGHADDGSLPIGGIYFVRVSGPGLEVSKRVVRLN
jgi:hypothetical protein